MLKPGPASSEGDRLHAKSYLSVKLINFAIMLDIEALKNVGISCNLEKLDFFGT